MRALSPVDPADPALRILRILHGLCPLCDLTEHHVHGTGDMTSRGGLGDWTYRDEAEVQAERARRKAGIRPSPDWWKVTPVR
jgi:hypothetical protein